MARRLIPKQCIVQSIELDGHGNAEIRYRCVREGRMETGQHTYPTKHGFSNYRSVNVKATSVNFRGMHVYGNAHMGFVLSPASAVCRRRGKEITCHLEGNTSSSSLSGVKRKRKRR